MLELGAKSPSFTLPTDNGDFNLADYHGKKMVVFFFPASGHIGLHQGSDRFFCAQG